MQGMYTLRKKKNTFKKKQQNLNMSSFLIGNEMANIDKNWSTWTWEFHTCQLGQIPSPIFVRGEGC